jgi:hypothetical protein
MKGSVQVYRVAKILQEADDVTICSTPPIPTAPNQAQ